MPGEHPAGKFDLPASEAGPAVQSGGTAEQVPWTYRLSERLWGEVEKWLADGLRVHPTDIYQVIGPEITAKVAALEEERDSLKADCQHLLQSTNKEVCDHLRDFRKLAEDRDSLQQQLSAERQARETAERELAEEKLCHQTSLRVQDQQEAIEHTLRADLEAVTRERDEVLHTIASRTPSAIRVCAVGVVRKNGCLLLGKRRQLDSAHGQWVMPGGGVNLGERIEDAVAREVREETGIEVRATRLLLLFQHFDDQCHRVVAFYEAEHLSGDPCSGSDLQDPQFIPEERLSEYSLSERTKEVLGLIASDTLRADLEAVTKERDENKGQWFRAMERIDGEREARVAAEAERDEARKQAEELAKTLSQLKSYAHCNCAPDDDGEVRYHSNCNRRMMPIIETALAKYGQEGGQEE